MGAFDPAKPHHRPSTTTRYRLRCPAGCQAPAVQGEDEAARLVRDHPAVCPRPGWAYQAAHSDHPVTFHPLVYSERVR